MEELQTTEALDREILEDARKKALRILKTADESAASSKASWERKLENTLNETRENYRKKEEGETREITARLPMDKRRIRLEKIEFFLDSAMNEFIGSLDRTAMLSLLEHELSRRFAVVETGAVDVSYSLCYRGLEKNELDGIVKKIMKHPPLSQNEDPLYTDAGSFPAVALDFPVLRISASVDAAAKSLLLEKRAELAAALLGKAALEDEQALDGAARD